MISRFGLLWIFFVFFHVFVHGKEGFTTNGYGISEDQELPCKILKGLYQYANSDREKEGIEGISDLIFDDYISKMKKEWKFKYFEIVRSEHQGNIQYYLVSCQIMIGIQEFERPAVIFFVKENGIWKLFNFPFYSSGVPRWSPNIIPHLCHYNNL